MTSEWQHFGQSPHTPILNAYGTFHFVLGRDAAGCRPNASHGTISAQIPFWSGSGRGLGEVRRLPRLPAPGPGKVWRWFQRCWKTISELCASRPHRILRREGFLYLGEDFLYYGEDFLNYGERLSVLRGTTFCTMGKTFCTMCHDFLYYGNEFLY